YSDSEKCDLVLLPQPENLQFFVRQLPEGFHNAKTSAFYPDKDLSLFSDNENEHNIRSNKTDETEEVSKEESKEENVINFNTPNLEYNPKTNIQTIDKCVLQIVL
ncbi:2583_t:CDS:1, partial [Ambispora leptoticha]